MMTNTYLPHVGGVARSVSTFAHEFIRQGHDVLVVAPTFSGKPLPREREAIVERIPSLQNFNGSDFSVKLPFAATLSDRIDAFEADIVHAHHPFLLGDTALRVALNKNVPIVFTHHTRYEDYTHYVPFSDTLKEVAIELPTHFANLCDGVIAPSESIARLIRRRGVKTPMTVVPTGIDVASFAKADGARGRRRHEIPNDAFVVGHVGRLALEKNLAYLGEAVALFLAAHANARFLVVGDGPAREAFEAVFTQHGVRDRLILAGKKTGAPLREAYRAMDAFAFASLSETQGMVVAEAMAARLPVVALNAPGVREVVASHNGVLLPSSASTAEFADALELVAANPANRQDLAMGAAETAAEFSQERSASRVLGFYEETIRATRAQRAENDLHPWTALLKRVGLEWDLVATRTQTLAAAVFGETKEKSAEEKPPAATPVGAGR
jgi:glycosyltransferase involved in cell wall biosynthesis